MTEGVRYELPSDAVLQIADDEALLVKLGAEEMYALNPTGTDIIQRILEGQTVESVIGELVDVYGADRSDISRDVHDLIEDLLHRGLLVAR